MIGISKVDITPSIGIRMDGYAKRSSVSNGILDKLFAKSVSMRIGNNTATITSLDLLGVNPLWQDSVNALGNVVLTATHTHSGPIICNEVLNWGSKCNDEENSYVESVGLNARRSAGGAIDNQFPVDNISVGRVFVGDICRDRDDPGKNIDVYATILAFKSGVEVKPFMIHLPCHPTTLGPENTMISSDIAGWITRKLESIYGSTVVFINGAAGNISTRYSRVKRGVEELERLSSIIVNRILGRINDGLEQIDAGELFFLSDGFNVRTRRPNIDAITNSSSMDAFEKSAVATIVSRLRRELIARMAILRLGDIIFVLMPFEPLFNVQIEIEKHVRQKRPQAIALVAGYSLDYLGYLSLEDNDTYESYMTLVEPLDAINHAKELIDKAIN